MFREGPHLPQIIIIIITSKSRRGRAIWGWGVYKDLLCSSFCCLLLPFSFPPFLFSFFLSFFLYLFLIEFLKSDRFEGGGVALPEYSSREGCGVEVQDSCEEASRKKLQDSYEEASRKKSRSRARVT